MLPKHWKRSIKPRLTAIANTKFHGQPHTDVHFTNRAANGELTIVGTRLVLPQPFAATAFHWLKTHPEDVVELEVFLKLAQHADGLMFDVGAHVGMFSVLFCKYSNFNVVAFEPVPNSQALIKQTAQLNHIEPERIAVVGKALGKEPGTLKMYVDPATGFAQIQPVKPRSDTAVTIGATTIDITRATARTRVALLKIDVEGGENEVLHGGSCTLREDRPIVSIELHNAALEGRGVNLEQMLSGIVEQEYCLMCLSGRDLTPRSAARAFLPRSHLLAIPKEKRLPYHRLLT
jgi:FkbM family methyltransferase